MSQSKRWKSHERIIAARLGTHRNANNGQRQNDIDTERFAIEHKTVNHHPSAFLRDAMYQAEEGAKKRGEDQLPIVVVSHGQGRGHRIERYVWMRFETFEEIISGSSEA